MCYEYISRLKKFWSKQQPHLRTIVIDRDLLVSIQVLAAFEYSQGVLNVDHKLLPLLANLI